jgi:pimeloyl-ACP methyl ester carboxylesterase
MLQLPLLDLRGEDCSISGVTEMTIRFLRDHVGQKAILVGNSFGGHVALRVALEAPHLVSGMVLAGSSGLIEKSMVSDVQIKPSREWLARKIGELFYKPELHMRESDLDRAHRALSDRHGARAMVRLSRSARRNHLGDRIGDIEAPTLLIWGKNDVVTPPEAAKEFLDRLPNARIVWFPQCGHVPMVEKPDEFARARLDFTAEMDGPPHYAARP